MLGTSCWEPHNPLQRTKELLQEEPHKAARYLLDQAPEEQIYIITQLSEDIPQKIIPFCELIDGEAQKRCMRVTHRPHLWTENASSTGQQPPPMPSQDCAHPHLCLEQKAIEAIHSGDVAQSRAYCHDISSKKWMEECLFHISEELLLSDVSQYATTLDICEELSLYRDNCIQHGIFTQASLLLETTNYSEAKIQVDKISTIWMKHNLDEAPMRISQLWAQWYHRLFDTPNAPPKNISPDIQHHYHSSLAFWGIRHAESISGDLEDHVQKLQKNTLSLLKKPRGLEPALSLWNLPTTQGDVYLGFSMRIVDDDPNIDLLIATLEAIGRLRPPRSDLLHPYMNHTHPKVQQTAQRILSFDLNNTAELLRPLSVISK